MGGGMSGNEGSLERHVSAPCLTSVWQADLSQGSSRTPGKGSSPASLALIRGWQCG